MSGEDFRNVRPENEVVYLPAKNPKNLLRTGVQYLERSAWVRFIEGGRHAHILCGDIKRVLSNRFGTYTGAFRIMAEIDERLLVYVQLRDATVQELSSYVPSHKQIATSTHYNPLKSLLLSSPTVTLTLAPALALMKLQICYASRVTHATHHTPAPSKVPPGHVPVHVGEAMEPPERFTIQVEMLNRPIFVGLLDRTAQELGYQQPGALRILCAVSIFRRLLLSLSSGGDGGAVAAEILSGELHEN